MSRLNVAINNDLQLLTVLRDEMKVQAHLLKADAKSRWSELEQKWSTLQEHLARAKVAGQGVSAEAESAIKMLIDVLRKGYASIRDALKK